jgi:hypothetical protein
MIAGIVSIPRQQPFPDTLARLHLMDCELPCWIGIMPGVTTSKEAKERVTQTYDKLYNLSFDDSSTKDVGYSVLRVHFQRKTNTEASRFSLTLVGSRRYPDIVSAIDFYSFERLDIGTLFSVLGKPSGVNVADDTSMGFYSYRHTNYAIIVEYQQSFSEHLELNVPINNISILVGDYAPCIAPWQGFRNKQFYYNKATDCGDS